MATIRTPALAGSTTTTTGLSDYSLGSSLPAPFRSLQSVLGDGDTFYYCCRDLVNFEEGVGTYHSASGGTVTRTTVLSSSIGNTAINWSSGTRNIFADFPSTGLCLSQNNLAEIASPATARTNLGITFGTAAGNVPQLDGSARLPAVDGSQLTNLPVVIPSGTVMAFYQDAAPVGWTRLTSINDKSVSITKGSASGGTAGGTNDNGPGGLGWGLAAWLTVGGHALLGNEIPILYSNSYSNTPGGSGALLSGGSAAAHTHPLSDAASYRPPQVYMILCQKN